MPVRDGPREPLAGIVPIRDGLGRRSLVELRPEAGRHLVEDAPCRRETGRDGGHFGGVGSVDGHENDAGRGLALSTRVNDYGVCTALDVALIEVVPSSRLRHLKRERRGKPARGVGIRALGARSWLRKCPGPARGRRDYG